MNKKAGVQKSYNKNSSWKNEMVIQISYSIFILMNLKKKPMNQTVQLFLARRSHWIHDESNLLLFYYIK